ncbi:hypothetical protein E1A91_A12G065900v1 [Gossypium mustelinum]|uniref:BZIP domain-containing protein n=1 Tax=Gossypium mustelinum TaxID=34275 RepID=A0A5D2WQR1_GOSMU|nr:hypothetical protein E1A91_A12G065900v1 [Gossypium mustelinum]
MSPVLSEILLSGFMINSTLRRRTHLVQSFSVVFLYCGASSGSSTLRSSSSSEDFQPILDERKRKRMLSNRESARRSRMRKQKHLDELMAQVSNLTNHNNQIHTSIKVTTQLYSNVEAENLVLRAQMTELSNRLQSLNEIIHFINSSNGVLQNDTNFDQAAYCHPHHQLNDDSLMNPWNFSTTNQPFMPSADMMMY